ncbi:hypothetical protein [Pontivivens nitratireducens]|uniref:hypothetical protein n=1 Tax=Pontivivens nitratireducens TaxID=2758038 RepID=UPI00163B2011|nr:hypothetical protein [Pontibrevibacter nitratireducens]
MRLPPIRQLPFAALALTCAPAIAMACTESNDALTIIETRTETVTMTLCGGEQTMEVAGTQLIDKEGYRINGQIYIPLLRGTFSSRPLITRPERSIRPTGNRCEPVLNAGTTVGGSRALTNCD